MKWKKLGKIFDPTEHNLSNNCVYFAQSPQALTFDNFVRIYFSTREKEVNGKFLSHIAYVDFDSDFKNIIKVSKKTIIPLGDLGTFDEHGIFPINPIRDDKKIIAYTCGWTRRISVPIETSIGMAISNDNGETFERVAAGPILTSSKDEAFLVGDGFTAKFDNVYHMWYIFSNKWTNNKNEGPTRVYKIAHAKSKNGIEWEKNSKYIIEDKLGPDECQALPTVIEQGGIYHMFFCYRHATDFRTNKDRAYRIGYASSKDMINWTRDDSKAGIDVSKKGWDSEMLCYPNAFKYKDKIYLLYNGNEFGKFGFGIAVLENC